MKCCWIATTPRTGSNFFCDLLFERAEIQTPKEFFNRDFLRRLNLLDDQSRLVVPSLAAFVDHIGQTWTDTVTPLCVKALYSQFEAVSALPGVRESISAHPVVMLVRRDIVAQAVSQHIARSTGRWISAESSRRDLEAVPYDFHAIDAAADRIERHNSQWRRIFRVSGITVEEIAYEQVKLQPDEIIDHVIGLLGLTRLAERRTVATPHHKQTTELNARFIEQYRHDKAKAIFGADA